MNESENDPNSLQPPAKVQDDIFAMAPIVRPPEANSK